MSWKHLEQLNRRLYETRAPHEYRDEGAIGAFRHITKCPTMIADGAYGPHAINTSLGGSSVRDGFVINGQVQAHKPAE